MLQFSLLENYYSPSPEHMLHGHPKLTGLPDSGRHLRYGIETEVRRKGDAPLRVGMLVYFVPREWDRMMDDYKEFDPILCKVVSYTDGTVTLRKK